MAKILDGYNYKNIKLAAKLIQKGELVAFPTETVYGLGADAFNKEAAAKIFEVKERPEFDPLIIHISSLKQLEEVAYVNKKEVLRLIHNFWPGPLTLILPKKKKIPYVVTSGLDTVAVRIPANIVALSLIQEAKTPIAAPSANLFGKLSPTTAEHVEKQLGKRIKIILDGGKTTIGIESTILFIDKKPKILRLGGLTVEEIEKILGKIEMVEKTEKILSPGQLKTHYSPFKPLKIISSYEEIDFLKKVAILGFRKVKNKEKFISCQILSPKGNLREAAGNFFDALHKLDESPAEIIYAEKVPEVYLGRAIMQRLRKAEFKN